MATALACSSAPKPHEPLPPTLAEVNRALSRHFADVTLTNEVVMHGLRAVEVTPESLAWTNEHGQRREMPIAEVARIVLRGRDPQATPPSEGAKLLDGTPPFPPEPEHGTPLEGPLDGGAAVAAAALYGVLYLASVGYEAPGVLIYEGPVSRYLAGPAAPELPQDPAQAEDDPRRDRR